MGETTWALYVRAHMAAHDWSQADLARRAGVAQSLVSRWVNGGGASVDAARAIARAIRRPLPEVLVATGIVTAAEMGIDPPEILLEGYDSQHIKEIIAKHELIAMLRDAADKYERDVTGTLNPSETKVLDLAEKDPEVKRFIDETFSMFVSKHAGRRPIPENAFENLIDSLASMLRGKYEGKIRESTHNEVDS